MSLKQKFLLRDWGLIFGLLLVGAASLWGLDGLRRQMRVPLTAYADMSMLDAASQEAKLAAEDLRSQTPNPQQARSRIVSAMEKTQQFIANEAKNYNSGGAEHAITNMQSALTDIGGSAPNLPAAAAALDKARDFMAVAVAMCHRFIEIKDKQAAQQLWDTIQMVGGVILVTLVCATVTSIFQYRSVMLPLEGLRQGVRRVAAAEFNGAVDERGGKEFSELARDFNSMAAELDGFYRKLEEKVIAKSQELVRSERLASVGFLAAGVAHEINNPLNIISGYAELSLKRLGARVDQSSVNDTLQVLRIIRDESFRCKEITGKLLSLAKGSSSREPLALDNVAREVVVLAGGLKDYRDRMIEMKFDEPLKVVANPTEMKQVLLNLTVNALQAVKPQGGRVSIEGRRRNGWVELSVCDNGEGIPSESLKHVFEPFYSRRPGARAPGTGLGLSITHAIVENHGGRLRAESPGAGLGSRFTVELPAVAMEDA